MKKDKPITKADRDEAVRAVVNKAIEWYRNSLHSGAKLNQIGMVIIPPTLFRGRQIGRAICAGRGN